MGAPGNPRKPYPEEFKREAVELLNWSGRPLAQVARELGVSAESLRLLAQASGDRRRRARRPEQRRAGRAARAAP
jgi:transposase